MFTLIFKKENEAGGKEEDDFLQIYKDLSYEVKMAASMTPSLMVPAQLISPSV